MNIDTRPIKITRNYIKYPEGSVLIEIGETKVICNATIEDKVPVFLRGQGKGWITAEYSMLPRATHSRTARESAKGKQSGRTMEIQRLIGRALRSVVILKQVGERTIWIDCDVIQADGGTRTAAITGAFVAMVDAFYSLYQKGELDLIPVTDFLAATSVGIVDGRTVLDLCYEQDSTATVDMNIVMTGKGKYVEIQGTGEENPFTADELASLLQAASIGCQKLINEQKQALGIEVVSLIDDVNHIMTEMTQRQSRTVVLASHNKGKVKEFNHYLQPLGWEVISMDQFPDIPPVIEDGQTFCENAIKKATEVMLATNLPTIADDSGIVVDALGGAPGIYSARYAGEDATDDANNEKLLSELEKVSAVTDDMRTAKFVACIAYVSPDSDEPLIFEGECQGVIANSPAGTGGFGYDPLFYISSEQQTMAEISLDRKNQISHRAIALRNMKNFFESR